MLSSIGKRLRTAHQCVRWFRTDTAPPARSRHPRNRPPARTLAAGKTEWWIVDGEMHEVGDNVPPRERFVIPRENVSNRRRKQLREQFMRRTRLVLKESQHEPWCNAYLELYQELRENWERLYWDEGFSKKIARDHANYESAEDDDRDFSPYRSRQSYPDRPMDQTVAREQGDTWQQVNQIRDKFEFDREKRMREKAFAPMRGGPTNDSPDSNRDQQFDVQKYFPQNERR